jgi:DNA-binding LacI/PurR family transcriptional regulator
MTLQLTVTELLFRRVVVVTKVEVGFRLRNKIGGNMSQAEVPRRPTIYDVALEARVSKSLVSLVLSNSPNVSESRREAVLKAIRKLDYAPSQAAKLLAGTRSKSIGVVIDDYSNLWFVGMLAGIRRVFDEAGYQITVSDLHRTGDGSEDPVDTFKSLHVDGIIVATEPDSLRDRVYDFPGVLVGDRMRTIPTMDHVTSDDMVGGYLATKHLIDLGHTAIGHITGAGGTAEKRKLGYMQAMAERNLQVRISGSNGKTDERAGFFGAQNLLEKTESLSAIFAANDYMAAGSIAYLRAAGKFVPNDLSVIGHDNSPTASEFNLNLTTVAYDDDAIGVNAAKLLLARIENPSAAIERKVILPQLVLRGTTLQI